MYTSAHSDKLYTRGLSSNRLLRMSWKILIKIVLQTPVIRANIQQSRMSMTLRMTASILAAITCLYCCSCIACIAVHVLQLLVIIWVR